MGEKFANADKKRLADLQRKKVYEFCVLRIICPDKSVLQVHFRAADKGQDILNKLQPLFSPTVQASSWYIYQSPPLKKLAPGETLAKAGLTPGANMYLGFDGEKPGPPFLEPGLVAQLGPAPEVPGRGVAGHSFSGEAMGWGAGQRLGSAPSASSAAAAAPSSG